MRRRRGGATVSAFPPSGGVGVRVMGSLEAVSMRDRTREFEAAVRSSAPAAAVPPSATAPGGATARRSAFARLAATVARDIEQTSAKLARLTKLAQRRTLFDDPTAHIQELTASIKQDLSSLNAKLDELQRARETNGRVGSRQAGEHSASVVTSLRGRLGATAEGFKSVLKLRTASLAAQQDRRAHFSSTNTPARAPMFAPAGQVALDLGSGSAGHTTNNGFGGAGGSEMRLAQVRRPGENTYQQARANAVRQVESTIVELGEIFNQLATMVSEQGEMVERIDANVEETASNMRAGQNQLIMYYNSVAGNRALILKVSAVLLIFVMLWMVIL